MDQGRNRRGKQRTNGTASPEGRDAPPSGEARTLLGLQGMAGNRAVGTVLRAAPSVETEPDTIRRLWDSETLYAEGGRPSKKAKAKSVRIGGFEIGRVGTYEKIGRLLDACHRADTVAKKREHYVEIESLIENWLGDEHHQDPVADAPRSVALLKLQDQVQQNAAIEAFVEGETSRGNPPDGYADWLRLLLPAWPGFSPARVNEMGTWQGPRNGLTQSSAAVELVAFSRSGRFADGPHSLHLARFSGGARSIITRTPQLFNGQQARLAERLFFSVMIKTPGFTGMALDLDMLADGNVEKISKWIGYARDEGPPYDRPPFINSLAALSGELIQKAVDDTKLLRNQLQRAREKLLAAGSESPPALERSILEARFTVAAARHGDWEMANVRLADLASTRDMWLAGAMTTQLDEEADQGARRLGGALNTVIETTFPGQAGGEGFTGWFKAEYDREKAKELADEDAREEGGAGKAGAVAGIPNFDPRQGNRSMATRRLDQLLGTDVIPRTEWARRNGVLGTVMADAGGRDLQMRHADKEDKASPVIGGGMEQEAEWLQPSVQRGMSDLQVLDAITGQLDRHPGNIMVMEGANGVLKVVGIDNDMAFSPRHVDPHTRVYEKAGDPFGPIEGMQDKRGGQLKALSHNVGIPALVDRRLAERIIDLHRNRQQEVRACLVDLLTESEIAATIARLRVVAEWLENNADALVEDWNQGTAQQTLDDPKADYHSYWARDVLHHKEKGVVTLNILNTDVVDANLRAGAAEPESLQENALERQIPAEEVDPNQLRDLW